jgi:propionate CoA-transferase
MKERQAWQLRQIAFYGKGGIGKSTTKIVSAAEAVSIIRSGDTPA